MISVVDHHQTGDSDEVAEDLATAASFSLCRCHFFFFIVAGSVKPCGGRNRGQHPNKDTRGGKRSSQAVLKRRIKPACVCVCAGMGVCGEKPQSIMPLLITLQAG